MIDLVITENPKDDFKKFFDLLIPESRLCVIVKDSFYMHKVILECERIGFDFMGGILIINREPYETICVFKKLGKKQKIDKEIKEKSKMTKEEWRMFFDNLWQIENDDEIYFRLIKMYAFWDNLVLCNRDVSIYGRRNYKLEE